MEISVSGIKGKLVNSAGSCYCTQRKIVIDEQEIYNKDPNFLNAVRYFNKVVLLAPMFTWEHFFLLKCLSIGEEINNDILSTRVQSAIKQRKKFKHYPLRGFFKGSSLHNTCC